MCCCCCGCARRRSSALLVGCGCAELALGTLVFAFNIARLYVAQAVVLQGSGDHILLALLYPLAGAAAIAAGARTPQILAPVYRPAQLGIGLLHLVLAVAGVVASPRAFELVYVVVRPYGGGPGDVVTVDDLNWLDYRLVDEIVKLLRMGTVERWTAFLAAFALVALVDALLLTSASVAIGRLLCGGHSSDGRFRPATLLSPAGETYSTTRADDLANKRSASIEMRTIAKSRSSPDNQTHLYSGSGRAEQVLYSGSGRAASAAAVQQPADNSGSGRAEQVPYSGSGRAAAAAVQQQRSEQPDYSGSGRSVSTTQRHRENGRLPNRATTSQLDANELEERRHRRTSSSGGEWSPAEIAAVQPRRGHSRDSDASSSHRHHRRQRRRRSAEGYENEAYVETPPPSRRRHRHHNRPHHQHRSTSSRRTVSSATLPADAQLYIRSEMPFDMLTGESGTYPIRRASAVQPPTVLAAAAARADQQLQLQQRRTLPPQYDVLRASQVEAII